MSYLKSQNGKIVILMNTIVAVKVSNVIGPSYDDERNIVKRCSYEVDVYCGACAFNMAEYSNEDDAIAIMNEIINRISKDKSYRIPLRKDDPIYEV